MAGRGKPDVNDTDIAVVGVGCRFPDAWTPTEFWRNIDQGVVSIRELTAEQLRAAGISEEAASAPDYVTIGTTLPGADDFAGEFFGYPPGEIEMIDPQQRIFLEACWEALESAGHPPGTDAADRRRLRGQRCRHVLRCGVRGQDPGAPGLPRRSTTGPHTGRRRPTS